MASSSSGDPVVGGTASTLKAGSTVVGNGDSLSDYELAPLAHLGRVFLDEVMDGRYVVTDTLLQRQIYLKGKPWDLAHDEDYRGALVLDEAFDGIGGYKLVEDLWDYDAFGSKQYEIFVGTRACKELVTLQSLLCNHKPAIATFALSPTTSTTSFDVAVFRSGCCLMLCSKLIITMTHRGRTSPATK